MGRRRSAALALACWLFAGCELAPLPSESGALACTNTSDDDEDGLMNCADPDCWGFAICRGYGDGQLPLEPVPPFIPEPTDDDVGPPSAPIVDVIDASVVPVDIPVTDAGLPPVLELPDAEVDAEAPVLCDERCPEGHCSVDGACDVPLILGNYSLATLEVLMPRRYVHTENNQLVCFDDPGPATCLIPDITGCCAPDPTVFVLVQSKKAGVIGPTDEAFSIWQSTGTWESTDIEVDLQEGDEIRFDVLDDDGQNEAGGTDYQPLFSCATTVTVGAIASGRIGCEPDEADEQPPIGVIHVTAILKRLPGTGVDGDMAAP